MSTARSLDVTIMGREYRVTCKPDEERELLDAVAYVDSQMREIRDSLKQNNAERVAVMTALNIANDLLRARTGGAGGDALDRALERDNAGSATAPAQQSSPESGVDLTGFKRRIQSMQSTIDATLTEQERLL